MWGDVPVKLDKTFSGIGPEIRITLHDQFASDSQPNILLRLRLEEYSQGDNVKIFWDGNLLDNVELEYQLQEDAQGNPFGGQIYDWSSAVWLSAVLSQSIADVGSHRIMVSLEKRNAQVKSDVVLTNVEIVVKHGFENADVNDGNYDRNIMKFGF